MLIACIALASNRATPRSGHKVIQSPFSLQSPRSIKTIPGPLNRLDVHGIRSLLTILNLELNYLTFRQHLETVSLV
jgi:hypothetical protein